MTNKIQCPSCDPEEPSIREFTPRDVRELREKTGLGMMDCKKALEETNGDMEAAIEGLLRKKRA